MICHKLLTVNYCYIADDTCLIFQRKDIIEIESALNKNISMFCDLFADNKLSVHFGEDKTKSILLCYQ